jgi:hypothetical protein
MEIGIDAAIFRTVAWFSLFNMPVTTFEVWEWLLYPDRAYRLEEVERALCESPWLAKKLARDGGWVALAGVAVEDFVKRREERFLDAARKFKKLKKAAHWFSTVPSVRAVAACNTLAWHQTTPQSDIDLFVLCDPGTVWATRLCLVTPFAFLGRRPGETNTDPFCFSFFLTTKDLNISSLALTPEDPYLALWSSSLVPVFDPDGWFERYHAANAWTRRYLPNAYARLPHEELSTHPFRPFRLFRLPRLFNTIARRLQERKFPKTIRDLANRDSCVVVSDRMLKFHENDRREEYRKRWESVVGSR